MKEKIQYVSNIYPYTTLMTWEFYKHKHSFWEIVICINGNATHYINDVEYKFSTGDIIIMKPNCTHDYKIAQNSNYAHYDFYTNANDVKKCCDIYALDFFAEITADDKPIHLKTTKQNTVAIAEKLKQLDAIQQQPSYAVLGESIYKTILQFIIGISHENYLTQNSQLPDWFKTIVSLMTSHEHIGDSVEDIVVLSGFSHGHLVKLFKKHTGQTLSEYFATIKMNYALTLLKNKDISILEISNYLGYSSLSHFIKLFKDYFDTTPKQYRKTLYQL